MEGFSFVTSVTGLNRPNTGKEEDDDVICYVFIMQKGPVMKTDVVKINGTEVWRAHENDTSLNDKTSPEGPFCIPCQDED
jgi:hypothetical protein